MQRVCRRTAPTRLGEILGDGVIEGTGQPSVGERAIHYARRGGTVVFMVTAPLLTVGVPVDLPKTKAKAIADSEEPLVISVNAEGVIFLQDTEVEIENLVPRLKAITANKADTRIYVRGDRSIDYGRVLEVMGTVNVAGFTRVALVAELPRGHSRAAREAMKKKQ